MGVSYRNGSGAVLALACAVALGACGGSHPRAHASAGPTGPTAPLGSTGPTGPTGHKGVRHAKVARRTTTRTSASASSTHTSSAAAKHAAAATGSHPSTPRSSHHTTRSSPPSGPLAATFSASGHSPKVGNWPITVTLTKGGRPVAGHIAPYQFLLNGQVVSTAPVTGVSPSFTGTFHDVINWPARSAGITLTFRVTVSSAYGTKTLDYVVTPHR
jgi:hypothetical protein